jgi:cell division septation protein DedD
LKLSNSTGGSATDLVLCNDLELDRQSDTASILGGMRGSNATVFYNRAAYSSRFSCYPPIGIYRTGSNAVIATLNAPIFLSDWRVQLPGLVPHSEPLQSDNVAPAPTEPTTSPGTASQSNAPVASANTDVTTTPQPDPSPSQIKTDAYLVQVAAVSRQEDAEILVSILRKKQYPVFAASDRDDHLYHVQVGPFSDQLEADAERKRLIADGYNATVASPK